jgi:hypothetical protein
MRLPIRQLLNLAYVLLAGRMDAADMALVAAGADMTARDASRRDAFDAWLLEPVGREAEGEKALLRFLGAA